jgi:hypothetical protein
VLCSGLNSMCNIRGGAVRVIAYGTTGSLAGRLRLKASSCGCGIATAIRYKICCRQVVMKLIRLGLRATCVGWVATGPL